MLLESCRFPGPAPPARFRDFLARPADWRIADRSAREEEFRLRWRQRQPDSHRRILLFRGTGPQADGGTERLPFRRPTPDSGETRLQPPGLCVALWPDFASR